MRRLTRNLTYTNVVATLALFIALGGVSWAAVKLPKNSVGSKQIKKNAVTSAKIKNRTITGSDVKNSTITGKQVNESSLGTVPSAAGAASADAVGGRLAPVAKRVGVSATDPVEATALDKAAGIPLLSSGAISLVGKCYRFGTEVGGAIVVRTTTDATINLPSSGAFFWGLPYLNAGKPDSASQVIMGSAGANAAERISGSPYSGDGTAITPDGHGVAYRVSGFVKNGTPAGGDGIYGPGDACIFTATGAAF